MGRTFFLRVFVVFFSALFVICHSRTALAQPVSITAPEWFITERTEIYINLWTRTLSLVKNGETVKTYKIGPGTPDTPTPIGDYRIVEKGVGWGKGFGSRWLGLNVPFGKYGIHGTNKPHLIGRYVSHGCIRMRNGDVEELFPLVPLHTPVRIDGPLLGKEGIDYRILVRGSRGSLVQFVQNRLKAAGYYTGPTNGIFDWNTEIAVKQFQKENRLPVTGQIHFGDLVELGAVE
ncbi:L,D-transpeptidase family protein [Bacillaceae bacterium]